MIVSLLAATPVMTIRLTLVMPSMVLAPVSGLMPVTVGDAPNETSSGLQPASATRPPSCNGVPLAIGDDGRGLGGRRPGR